jgi:hypothetical protein
LRRRRRRGRRRRRSPIATITTHVVKAFWNFHGDCGRNIISQCR